MLTHMGQRVHAAAVRWLFNVGRMILLHLPDRPDRLTRWVTAVEVEANIYPVADRLSYRPSTSDVALRVQPDLDLQGFPARLEDYPGLHVHLILVPIGFFRSLLLAGSILPYIMTHLGETRGIRRQDHGIVLYSFLFPQRVTVLNGLDAVCDMSRTVFSLEEHQAVNALPCGRNYNPRTVTSGLPCFSIWYPHPPFIAFSMKMVI